MNDEIRKEYEKLTGHKYQRLPLHEQLQPAPVRASLLIGLLGLLVLIPALVAWWVK